MFKEEEDKIHKHKEPQVHSKIEEDEEEDERETDKNLVITQHEDIWIRIKHSQSATHHAKWNIMF